MDEGSRSRPSGSGGCARGTDLRQQLRCRWRRRVALRRVPAQWFRPAQGRRGCPRVHPAQERLCGNSMTDRVVAYRKVADELRAAIRRGDFDGDTPLPTDTELAERYQIGRQTVRRAFQDLVAEGMI